MLQKVSDAKPAIGDFSNTIGHLSYLVQEFPALIFHCVQKWDGKNRRQRHIYKLHDHASMCCSNVEEEIAGSMLDVNYG